jgi:hypothetical protein
VAKGRADEGDAHPSGPTDQLEDVARRAPVLPFDDPLAERRTPARDDVRGPTGDATNLLLGHPERELADRAPRADDGARLPSRVRRGRADHSEGKDREHHDPDQGS